MNVCATKLFLCALLFAELAADTDNYLRGIGGGPGNTLIYHPYGYGGFDRFVSIIKFF